MRILKDLIPTVMEFQDEFNDFSNLGTGTKFHKMNSPFYGGEKWAVRKLSMVLNKNNEWEIEPIPSERNKAFYERCRFDYIEDALKAYNISRFGKEK